MSAAGLKPISGQSQRGLIVGNFHCNWIGVNAVDFSQCKMHESFMFRMSRRWTRSE